MRVVASVRWGLAVTVAVAASLPVTSRAQLPPPPPYPDAPEVTEPLEQAMLDAGDTVAPIADDALSELGLAGHLAGPALRPGCSAVTSVVVASVLGAGYTPVRVPLGLYVSPISYFCTFAYNVGTLDYALRDVDDAVGPTVSDVSAATLDPASDALAPVHEQAEAGCGYSPLVAAPLAQLPPPLHRIGVIDLACGKPG